jgi:hypothetical protein
VRRRGTGRGLLHKGARLVVLLSVLGACQSTPRITIRGTSRETARGDVAASTVQGAMRNDGPMRDRSAVGGAGKRAPVRKARGQPTERSFMDPSRSRLPSSRITHRARRLLIALQRPGHRHAGPQTGKSNSAGVPTNPAVAPVRAAAMQRRRGQQEASRRNARTQQAKVPRTGRGRLHRGRSARGASRRGDSRASAAGRHELAGVSRRLPSRAGPGRDELPRSPSIRGGPLV